jgi:hypothetical protein
VSIVAACLLAAAVVLLVAAEWPRISQRTGLDARRARARKRARSHLRVVDDDSEDFAKAVERDLANLPTYDPRAKSD